MNSVRLEIFLRDKNRCVLSGKKENLCKSPHHCFFRSEYFGEDRDEPWNLITISEDIHYAIHHGAGGRKYEKRAKLIAFKRYKGKNKEKLLKILKVKCQKV